MTRMVENYFNLVIDPVTFKRYVTNTPIIRVTKSGKKFKDYQSRRKVQAHEFKCMTKEEFISELTRNGYQRTHVESFIETEGITFKE